jgi:hypothetical protein
VLRTEVKVAEQASNRTASTCALPLSASNVTSPWSPSQQLTPCPTWRLAWAWPATASESPCRHGHASQPPLSDLSNVEEVKEEL